MDFGVVGLEGLVDSQNMSSTKPNPYGSGFLKQERSKLCEDDWSSTSKMAKTMPLLRSNSLQLSFSPPLLTKSGSFIERNTQNTTFPYYQHRNGGYGSFSGVRGPFTPSQWIELEHQALIYKHITANVPVPSTLLIPIRKSLNISGFSGLSSSSSSSHSLGWGSFQMGFSGNTDPEPGRCRRTDGKKWRCSKDAVAEQKYCERHINRGRHRSRKPVEGQQTGLSVSKVGPMASSIVSSAAPSSTRMQDSVGPTINPKSREKLFSIPKQEKNPFEESSQSDFDSFLNLPHMNYNKTYACFSEVSPKDQSTRSSMGWPEELKSDWTQLSMSGPMASDFSSSSSSPIADHRLALSTQMGLGLGLSNELSWGSSMGGPLGEALNNTSRLQVGTSPTGVLQKQTFVSLSTSSSGSSPRAQN